MGPARALLPGTRQDMGEPVARFSDFVGNIIYAD
jgi:hypothetical protein